MILITYCNSFIYIFVVFITKPLMIATIKTESELRESCTAETSEGFHLKHQYFPKESLRFCGQMLEFELAFLGVYACKIDGEYHFFSQNALNLS